ncbi:MAG: DUF6089 family protein [Saprospiraceae bacterium]
MRILTCLTSLLLFTSVLSAQYTEVGMAVGVANYAGELTSDGFRASEYHPSIGVFGRYNHSPRLAAKGSVTVGQISGSDANSGKANTLSRNLDFRSPLYEIAAMGEFNITPYAIRNNQGASLYLTAGVAGFYFNPQAQFNGEWFDLQPLGTEGQGSSLHPDMKRYSRVQAAIPFGGGVKMNVTDRFNLGFEVIFRRTFTDYLDDISGLYPDVDALYAENPLAATLSFRSPQYTLNAMENPTGTKRGNSAVKDYYMFAQLTMSFNLTHKQGLDFDKKYDIFKDPPPALSSLMSWEMIPRA